MEWIETTLGEILNFRRGHDLPHSKMVDGNIPVAGSNGIIGFHNIATPIKPILTIGRSGNVGTPYFYDEAWAHNTTLYVDDFKGNDPKYLYYLCLTLPFSSYRGGSAVPTLNRNHIHPLQVKFTPNIADQRRIASILSSLDKKIETNNKINANLEEMAQAIFKNWFVDFAPFKDGKFVESELGMIPEGWRVGTIGELINTTSGGTPSRKNEEYYINGSTCWVKSKELSGGYILDTEEKITEEALKKSSAKIIPTNSVLIAMYGATVGEYGILAKEMTCNQAVCALIPNDKVPFTFLFMFAKNEKNELVNSAIGSAQQNISQVIIKAKKVVYEEKTVLAFHEKVKPLFEKIKLNQQENARLASLRDTLLPRLMSGEIEV